MEGRDDDKERGDGAGRGENERLRRRRPLEEELGIGDDPTRGRREGDEVTPTATRGAVPRVGKGNPTSCSQGSVLAISSSNNGSFAN